MYPVQDGWNALVVTSYYGHANVAKVLIEAGANVNLANKVGALRLLNL